MDNLLSRRLFMGISAATGGVALAGGFARSVGAAAAEDGWPPLPPVKIHVVYVGLGGAWPKPEFDAPAEVARFAAYLQGVQERLGDVVFTGGRLIPNRMAEAEQEAATVGDADAVLVIHLSFGNGDPLAAFTKIGLPVAVYSQPFSGHDWMYAPRWRKAGMCILLAPSSAMSELDRLAALLRVPARMRQTKIVLVGNAQGTPDACNADLVRQAFGCEVVPVSVDAVVKAHGEVPLPDAEAEAEACWIAAAKKIVEPTRDEIVKSARMYLAMKNLMLAHGARAITINCLDGIPIDILGYPCLAFSKLNDMGLPGACEADMDSTLTMLLFGYAFGLPGFITDPLFDTARNATIHAHCVAPTRMGGSGDTRAPFLIRTHRDDNKGAALEVELKVGQEITCAKLVHLRHMLLSTGKITEIPDFDDRGCRTQAVAEVADARRMARNWGSGLLDEADMMTLLHRVVFYGNHVNDVEDLGALMGFETTLEG